MGFVSVSHSGAVHIVEYATRQRQDLKCTNSVLKYQSFKIRVW